MFYPENALKRGGKFYLCWVADSWPSRFKKLTYRQLWSQDIRIICKDLRDVVTKESGSPNARFSLRLSSQLLRGLVRLYQAKVASYLGTLCMLNANVIRGINQKLIPEERRQTNVSRNQVVVRRPKRARITEVVPENEERVEERVQNSGNVANIEEITLREAVIPEIQVPVDGFGEENPDQALLLLGDRTLEQMLCAGPAPAQLSGLELPDASHELSRLVPPRMEHDLTFIRRSAEQMSGLEYDKDVPIPEIPPPALPIPSPEQVQVPLEAVLEPEAAAEVEKVPVIPTELEELDEVEPVPKKRRVRKLIIDKQIKIGNNVFRQRLENVAVELRCEDSSQDVIDPSVVPWRALLARPARAALARPLAHLFVRNLGIVGPVLKDPELEVMLANGGMRNLRSRRASKAEWDRTLELSQRRPLLEPIPEQAVELELEPPSPRKRSAELDFASPKAKKCRQSGFVSFRRKGPRMAKAEQYLPDLDILPPNDKDTSLYEKDAPVEKEFKDIPCDEEQIPVPTEETHISQMLQAAGLADAALVEETGKKTQNKTRQFSSEESNETPLGSLDRTAVDLGESVRSTDTQKFLRKEWGTQGTMCLVARLLRAGAGPLSVPALLARGPPPPPARGPSPTPRNPGRAQRAIAARCFTSLLKLKQHGFLCLEKDPVSFEITDITCGPRLRTLA